MTCGRPPARPTIEHCPLACPWTGEARICKPRDAPRLAPSQVLTRCAITRKCGQFVREREEGALISRGRKEGRRPSSDICDLQLSYYCVTKVIVISHWAVRMCRSPLPKCFGISPNPIEGAAAAASATNLKFPQTKEGERNRFISSSPLSPSLSPHSLGRGECRYLHSRRGKKGRPTNNGFGSAAPLALSLFFAVSVSRFFPEEEMRRDVSDALHRIRHNYNTARAKCRTVLLLTFCINPVACSLPGRIEPVKPQHDMCVRHGIFIYYCLARALERSNALPPRCLSPSFSPSTHPLKVTNFFPIPIRVSNERRRRHRSRT